MFCSSSHASVACQIGTYWLASHSLNSGTMAGASSAVLARMKPSGSAGRRDMLRCSSQIPGDDGHRQQYADPGVGLELGEAVRWVVRLQQRDLPAEVERDHQHEA